MTWEHSFDTAKQAEQVQMTAMPWQEEEVITLFGGGSGGAGNVTAVRVVRDAKTGKGKGIAFVEFAGRGDARMALALDGRQLRGRAMRVTRVARTGASDAQEGLGSRLRTPFSRGASMETFGQTQTRTDHASMLTWI